MKLDQSKAEASGAALQVVGAQGPVYHAPALRALLGLEQGPTGDEHLGSQAWLSAETARALELRGQARAAGQFVAPSFPGECLHRDGQFLSVTIVETPVQWEDTAALLRQYVPREAAPQPVSAANAAAAAAAVAHGKGRDSDAEGRGDAGQDAVAMLKALQEIHTLYVQEADPKHLFDNVLSHLLRLAGSAYGFIGEILRTADGTPYLKTHAITNIAWNEETRRFYEQNAPQGLEFVNLETLFGAVITSGAPVLANNPAGDPRSGGLPAGHPAMNSFLGVPIHHGERMVGMAGMANRAGGYDAAMVDFLQPLLGAAGGFIGAQRNLQLRFEAEREVRRGQRLLRTVFDTLPHRLFVTDSQGRLRMANRATLQAYDLVPEIALGSALSHALSAYPEHARVLGAAESEARDAGQKVLRRGVALTREGEDLGHFDLTQIPLHDDDGAVSGTLGILQDLTDQTRVAERLAEREGRYKVLMTHTPIGIAEVAADGYVVYANERWYDLTGQNGQPGAGADPLFWLDTIHPDDRQQMIEKHLPSMLAGGDVTAEFRQIRPEGGDVWVRGRATALPAGTNGERHFLGSIMDISDLVVTEQALSEAGERLRNVVQNVPVGILELDRQGACTYANARWSELSGQSADATQGRGWAAAILRKDRRQVLRQMWEAAQLAAPFSFDFRLRTPDGVERWVAGQGTPRRGDDGGLTGYLGAITDISALKESEASLRLSEEHFRRAFTDAAVGMAMVSTTGLWIDCNPALAEMVGRTRDQLIGTYFQDITHPEDRDISMAQLPALLSGERRSGRFEKRYLHADGSTVWADITTFLLRNDAGAPLYLVSQIQDITRSKQAALELEEREAYLHSVLQTAVNAIISITSRGAVGIFNAAAEVLFGYAASEVVGRNINMLMPEPYRSQHDGYLESYVRTGEARIIGIGREVRGRRKDGTTFPMSLAVSEVGAGQERNFIGIVQDISERVAHEVRIVEQNQQLQSIFTHMAEGIIVTDAEGKITQVNPTLARILGGQVEDATGGEGEAGTMGLRFGQQTASRVEELAESVELRGEDGVRLSAAHLPMCRVLSTGEPLVSEPVQLVLPAEVLDILASSAPIFDPLGNITGSVTVLQDVTHIKALDRMKSEFVATVSHELRTPLASILGYADLIQEGDAGEVTVQQQEFLHIIIQNAERLRELIDDLLDIEHLEGGSIALNPTPVYLEAVLRQVADTFRVGAEKKGLSLRCEAPPDSMLLGDRSRLVQVFSNLVSNAIKYTPAGGVSMVAVPKNGGVEVRVSDTGIGLSPASLEKIFTRFFRADDAVVRAAGGTGLGLTIAKAIVEQHGGRIEVSSSPGAGTEFSVWLPSTGAVDSGAPQG